MKKLLRFILAFAFILMLVVGTTACTTSDINVDVTPVLEAIVTAVMIPVVTALGAYLTALIRTKIKNELAAAYTKRATDAVLAAVAETMQTFVSELKKTGAWSQDSWQIAFDKSKARAIEIMGTAARDALPDIVGDIDAWLQANIEAATLEKKYSAPIMLSEVSCQNE